MSQRLVYNCILKNTAIPVKLQILWSFKLGDKSLFSDKFVESRLRWHLGLLFKNKLLMKKGTPILLNDRPALLFYNFYFRIHQNVKSNHSLSYTLTLNSTKNITIMRIVIEWVGGSYTGTKDKVITENHCHWLILQHKEVWISWNYVHFVFLDSSVLLICRRDRLTWSCFICVIKTVDWWNQFPFKIYRIIFIKGQLNSE